MPTNRGDSTAFLLAQLGGHAARMFAERVAPLDLTPPQAGLLRAVAHHPGQSQQTLAKHLGAPPARLVALVDDLETRGLLERRRNARDRRLYAVHLTAEGERVIRQIGQVAREHDAALLRALDPDERKQLRNLLARIAEDQGLSEGVHPGYRNLRPVDTAAPSKTNREDRPSGA